MAMRISREWLRRLAAHLTTPLIVGLFWGLLLTEDRSWPNLWGAIVLCYMGWLFVGLPALLVRHRDGERRPWVYPMVGAALASFPMMFFGFGTLAEPSPILAFVPLGAVAGVWYWLVAHWRPSALGAPAGGTT